MRARVRRGESLSGVACGMDAGKGKRKGGSEGVVDLLSRNGASLIVMYITHYIAQFLPRNGASLIVRTLHIALLDFWRDYSRLL